MSENLESKAHRDLIWIGFINLALLLVSLFLENSIFKSGEIDKIIFDLGVTLLPSIFILVAGLFSEHSQLNRFLVGLGIFVILFNIYLNLLTPFTPNV